MDSIKFTNRIQILGSESNHSIGTLLKALSDIYVHHSEMSILVPLLLPVE